MISGRTVFSQLLDFLPWDEFDKCMRRYRGNHRARKFSCYDQFLCLVFVQLTYRESLRDIETCLRAMETKLYHAGNCGRISCSTLADANETRSWQIYADFAQGLIGIARELDTNDQFAVEVDWNLYSILQILSVTLFEKPKFAGTFASR